MIDHQMEEPNKCTYCGKETDNLMEFFPHEAGEYCIFAPRYSIDYACEDCSYKHCKKCNTKQIRFAFIECESCNITHWFNNTDMRFENNGFLSGIKLCDARYCQKKGA